MFWVICYDIVDNKRRRRVMRTLEGYGRRVQFSVFECELNADRVDQLEQRLRRLIHEKEDNIRFYPLAEPQVKSIRTLGNTAVTRLQAVYFVDDSSSKFPF